MLLALCHQQMSLKYSCFLSLKRNSCRSMTAAQVAPLQDNLCNYQFNLLVPTSHLLPTPASPACFPTSNTWILTCLAPFPYLDRWSFTEYHLYILDSTNHALKLNKLNNCGMRTGITSGYYLYSSTLLSVSCQSPLVVKNKC